VTAKGFRVWRWVHKWTSLVCTSFMLLLCITGLPLIFSHEINHWLHSDIQPQKVAPGTPDAAMDPVLAAAQARHPKLVPLFMSQAADEPEMWQVSLAKTPTEQEALRTVIVDARTAAVLGEPRFDEGFMAVMLRLHVDLFAGLPGKLFLGVMGLLLVVAIVSGVVLYAPFMRKLEFGSVRHHRTPRVRWLDLHNLLGIVTLVWASVVGLTGVINTLGEPVIKLWRADQMTEMLAPYKGKTPPAKRASLQASVNAARALEPSMRVGFIAFPGTDFASPFHYNVFMQGNAPLTSRLFKPVLVDASTAQVSDSRALPWYVSTVLISQPLHFGNYGGLPMKIVWVALDIATIFVLGSGLVLWAKRKQPRSLAEEAGASAEAAADAATVAAAAAGAGAGAVKAVA
jgi:uncharacterized iron-regulated membrane protein